ncbi:hypothetical protein GCM10027181_03440 [Rheinheimera gaetbuli]
MEPVPGGVGDAVIGVAIFKAVSIVRQADVVAAAGVLPLSNSVIAVRTYNLTSAKQALSAELIV